jgi:hypothetical protein
MGRVRHRRVDMRALDTGSAAGRKCGIGDATRQTFGVPAP